MPSPAPDASSDKSNALANSALPSDKNSILGPAPVDFFQASNTNTSLTPVTAIVSTFLPLNMSAVVFTAGPSGPITRNFASGRRSPTLTDMFLSSGYADQFLSGR